MNPFAYARVNSPEDASKKASQGALMKAGGVDLLSRMKRGTLHPELLVDLCFLKDMGGLADMAEQGWSLGALLKLAEIAEFETSKSLALAGLREAAELCATPQIRNRATLSGVLLQSPRCWYLHSADIDCEGKEGQGCPALEGRNEHHAILGYDRCPTTNASNLAPVLCALDAQLVYRPSSGGLEELSLRSLYEAPSKHRGFLTHRLPKAAIVQAIRIPRRDLVTAHSEIRHKSSHDWALCSAAVALRLEGGKITELSCFLGSVAPTPWRASKAEALLRGQKPDRGAFAKAAAAELESARPLSEGAYKVKMSQVSMIRALESAVLRAEESQG